MKKKHTSEEIGNMGSSRAIRARIKVPLRLNLATSESELKLNNVLIASIIKDKVISLV